MGRVALDLTGVIMAIGDKIQPMIAFKDLQRRLGATLELNRPGARDPHVLIAMPSFSLGETTLSHYAARIPALEHRYLNALYLLNRIENCEFVFLSTLTPAPEILDYCISLLPPERRNDVRSRFRSVAVPDERPRPLAEKLLGRPDILDAIRTSLAGRPAFIEPWNVTEHEVEVARRLEAPINGTSPELWPIGFKSAGRRIFREAGVPLPMGRENVRTVEDVVAAIAAIRGKHRDSPGVVIKHDNSGSGDGNVVIRFSGETPDQIRNRVATLPDWYLRDLQSGGIVEELIAGQKFASPSAQLDILPDGRVVILATHEQVLGGPDGQVYMGCRFPADPAYAADLARHAAAIGAKLAAQGAMGRFSVDFAAAEDASGQWHVYALEINLRKGGTTHPYAALRNLVPGRYDASGGQWLAADGTPRSYCATDNFVDPNWQGVRPAAVIKRIADAGLQFDYKTGTGVVLHMLSCLAIDGRFGLTAIGRTPAHAMHLHDATKVAMSGANARGLS